jgi:hypothetical protein
VDRRQVLFEIVGDVIEELALVHRSGRPALRARAVVGDDHDEGVVVFADVLEEGDQFADVVIGVLEKAREHLHHPRVQAPLVGGKLAPVLDVGIVPRQLRVLRHNAQLFLPGEHLLAVGVPSGVEFALVFVGPFLRHMMGRVHSAGAEVHEERLVGRDLLRIGDHRLRFADKVRRKMIALFGSLVGFGLAVVAHQLRIVLVGVAAEKAIEALEPAAERPAVIRAGRRGLFGWGQMPLAERVGVIAMLQQDF